MSSGEAITNINESDTDNRPAGIKFSMPSIIEQILDFKEGSKHSGSTGKMSLNSRKINQIKNQKTLTRPERNTLDDPDNAHYHYAQKVKSSSNALVLASTTGIDPLLTKTKNLANRRLVTDITNEKFDKNAHKRHSHQKLGRTDTLWILYCYIVTFWATPKMLSWFGMTSKDQQMAWKEKVALISIFFYCGCFITFLTFGFNTTFCKPKELVDIPFDKITKSQILVHGLIYNKSQFDVFELEGDIGGKDLSFLFQNVNGNCRGIINNDKYNSDILPFYFPCTITDNVFQVGKCMNSPSERSTFYNLKPSGAAMYTWENITKSTNSSLVVYDGSVLNLDLVKKLKNLPDIETPLEFDVLLQDYYTKCDISHLFSDYTRGQMIGRCLVEIAKIGTVDSETVGCVTSKAVLSISLVLIIGIIFARFLVAVYYSWAVAPFQGVPKRNKLKNEFSKSPIDCVEITEEFLKSLKHITVPIQEFLKCKNQQAAYTISLPLNNSNLLSNNPSKESVLSGTEFNNTLNPNLIHLNALRQPNLGYMPFGYPLLHTICFITCYSESKEGIKSTLDSVCRTDYPNSHKLLMVVCDGLIKGSGNSKSTPELVLEMISDFCVDPSLVKPYSYVSVAFGSKRHNMAKVYSGFYLYIAEENHKGVSLQIKKKECKVPIICVVKCGTLEEQATASKSGNRGKRDSQVILMSFLEKLFFNDRMSQLEYQILKNMWMITGIMPSYYEVVLTIDADTEVYKESIKHMVAEMCKDPEIMGLCGETQIKNKLESWVTAIQVFEYFISHHQAKAFESVFATVTCLPGCFSMYRIKAPKDKNGFWVPILANPDIVERYSDNVTNSLHKKNLLQLGEDRFLTSLLLKTFPKRKQIFVSKAVCSTLVPSTFRVLLSQRRRWINSTIHNLMELLLVNDLCGVFCFSMQFLILIDLIGSIVLPLAICFTFYVIFFAIFSEPTPYLTLILLAIIIGLPGILIVLTGANLANFIYMFFYIIALPIWNLLLPLYAFWKLDDFSWGETRVVEGDNKNEDEIGLFDASRIYMKQWREMAKEDTN